MLAVEVLLTVLRLLVALEELRLVLAAVVLEALEELLIALEEEDVALEKLEELEVEVVLDDTRAEGAYARTISGYVLLCCAAGITGCPLTSRAYFEPMVPRS